MGMFDYFKSSAYIGPDFTNVLCQTKDLLDGMGDGGTMDFHWMDRAGVLWVVDYSKTHEPKFLEKDDPRYDHSALWANMIWEQTGERGRVRVKREVEGFVEVYPCDSHYRHRPLLRCRLYIDCGVLVGYEEIIYDEYV